MHPLLLQFGSLVIPSYGVCVALGVLLALIAARATARLAGVDPRHVWNMLILAVFAALAGSRLFLIAMNLGNLRKHPSWLLAISMVHHPLLAAVAVVCGAIAIVAYARWQHLSFAQVADAFAAPLSFGIAAEQIGAWLAGSDFGIASPYTSPLMAVTYNNDLAARWSGTPLEVPLYPVQLYAVAGALLLAAIAWAWLLLPHRTGDVAGSWLIGAGILLFVTESFRDWEGRGVLLHGAADIPQLTAMGLVLCGGALLLQWRPIKGIHVVSPLDRDSVSREAR